MMCVCVCTFDMRGFTIATNKQKARCKSTTVKNHRCDTNVYA